MLDLDNVIIGGGPVGLLTAISLANLGYKTTIFDIAIHQLAKHQDGRVLSLSYASYDYLRKLGINISNNLLTPIKQVHVSHSGFGVSRINADLINQQQLGFTIKYADLHQAIYKKISQLKTGMVNIINNQVLSVDSNSDFSIISYEDHSNSLSQSRVQQLIMAEGGNLSNQLINYHLYDYEQIAIITEIKSDIYHQNIAYERFDKDGVMALLPHLDNYVLIFVVAKKQQQYFSQSSNLIHYLSQHNFMKKLGRFELLGELKSFPLKLKITNQRIINNIALLGSSAQIINPVAAQGLNLSIRDVKVFSQLVAKYSLNIAKVSNEYDVLRNHDIKFVKYFTHGLSAFIIDNNLFTNTIRSLGLLTLDNLTPIKSSLVHSLVFGS